jgi:hypothetical protein
MTSCKATLPQIGGCLAEVNAGQPLLSPRFDHQGVSFGLIPGLEYDANGGF